MSSQISHATFVPSGPLTQSDLEALRCRAHDISDLDANTLARVQAGILHAYRVAKRVSEGTLDPLSASLSARA